MAKSELRTKVAILRAAIGISMREFADLTGRTFYTWKALESKRLRLSEELAARISVETGASMDWLLNDNQSGPPFDNDGYLMTKENFESYRALVLTKDVTPEFMSHATGYQGELLKCLLGAIRDPQHYSLANYLTARFLRQLRRRFQIQEVFEIEMTGVVPPAPKKAAESSKKQP